MRLGRKWAGNYIRRDKVLEKIFEFIIIGLGAFTFSVIIVYISVSIGGYIQVKIKRGRDVNVNIKHINNLIYKINNQGKRVKAKGKYMTLEDIKEVELSDKEIK